MIYLYDLTPTLSIDRADPAKAAAAWDEAHSVATLQGIVNRDAPVLYVRFVEMHGRNIDDWWLERLRAPGAWLADATIRRIGSLEELVATFHARIRGVVLYDPKVAATSNLASTIAGVEDLIAVRYDPAPGSVYQRLVAGGPRLEVVRRLVRPDGTPMFTGSGTIPDTDLPSSGSAKCDAYMWAKVQYLDTRRCNPAYMGYYIDSFWIAHAAAGPPNHHTLTNHDFFVARRAFFCDLNCWGEETPVDDPRQPIGADRRTLQSILLTLYETGGKESMIHIGGFTPWAYKYTQHGQAGGKHGGVDTEWEHVRLVSAYNGFIDADALGLGAMANASFYAHFPLKDRYPQHRRLTGDDLKARGLVREDDRQFILFYVGDYDSAPWLYQRIPDLWDHPDRGKLPLAWAISPVLERRAPMAMDWLRRTATPNDFFVAADNGAGYLNPSMLAEPRPISGLPSGLDAWRRFNRAFYDRWDLTISGFIIDGHAPAMDRACLDALASFSPGGVVPQKVPAPALLHGNMPVLRSGPDINDNDPVKAARAVLDTIAARKPMRFHWFRDILKPPSWHVAVMEEITRQNPKVVLLDPHTFFELLRIDLQAKERDR